MTIVYDRMSWWAKLLAGPFILPIVLFAMLLAVLGFVMLLMCIPLFVVLTGIALLDGGKAFKE